MSVAVSADHVIETFEAAKEENALDRFRENQVVNLPPDGEVWMTGDMHDHRGNFAKAVQHADLGDNPNRHLILHELIHGDHYDANGAEDSWHMLYRAAELKCDFPDQVHFLLANHDLAQIHGEGIMKGGLSVCEAFNAGVARDFGSRAATVQVAITEFLLSLPLAVRCPNGLFFCHSLPPDDQIPGFDFSVFEREQLTANDYRRRTGPVYQLIWGRKVTPAGVEQFAQKVNAQLIVTGHQPQETGYAINGPRHLIIASDHNQGVLLPLSTSETYTMESMARRMKRFVALAVDED
jgi:hypothetical protein